MDACGQMALDETLLRAPPSPPDASFTPWLRFYLWSTPALTFGYAQKWMDIAPLAPPARYPSITRRLTGGGLVPHLTDLTFSAAFPAPHPWCPREIYRLLHTHLQFHLQVVGCPSALSPSLPPAPIYHLGLTRGGDK